MDPQGRALGPATTSFTDYVGTVAADDAEAVMDRPSLYELAQIDRDRYTIVGIELNVDGPTTAAVYAFDRSVHSVARLEEIVELGLSRGQIPVVRFDIPKVANRSPLTRKNARNHPRQRAGRGHDLPGHLGAAPTGQLRSGPRR